jgi:hypothetical protein
MNQRPYSVAAYVIIWSLITIVIGKALYDHYSDQSSPFVIHVKTIDEMLNGSS